MLSLSPQGNTQGRCWEAQPLRRQQGLPACRPWALAHAPPRQVNRILAAHKAKNKLPIQYKIGPDPSSIDSCMASHAAAAPGSAGQHSPEHALR